MAEAIDKASKIRYITYQPVRMLKGLKMRRNKEDTELSKLRILNAAEEVFCQAGYSGAKMNEIAQMTGMTKGAVFWHFESKANLFRAVQARSVARLREIFYAVFSTSAPIMEKFRRALLQVRKDKAFEVLLSLELGEASGGSVPSQLLLETQKNISDIIEMARVNIEKARENGEIHADTDFYDILSPLLLIMSGFGKMTEMKRMLGALAGPVDGDKAINAVFKGLNSFQKYV
jgi:AcrR family transcriptional regulator